MATKNKKKNLVGQFGPRYGRKVRAKVSSLEILRRKKQECPYCKKKGAKRVSKGIWYCQKCDKKFASDTYFITTKPIISN